MKSIFNANDNREFIDRINQLTPTSKAKWGKMNVGQMLKHCHGPMDVAFGKLDLKMNFFMSIIGKMFKNKILGGTEFKKNSPTVKEFIIKEDYNFEEAKQGLIERLNTFSELKENAIKNRKHPFFGNMNTDEWSKLQIMHLEHHLSQFGV